MIAKIIEMHYKLTEEIIALSVCEQSDFAKLEWDFALCGHYPVLNICVIKNRENLNTTKVGSCCVNKFLGIDDGNKIFSSIKK